VESVCKVKVAEDGCGVVVELGGVMGKAMEEGATRQNKRETPGASHITASSCATSGSLSRLPKAQPRVTTIAPTTSKQHDNGPVAEWL
jgi:hypothetical protein